jgi:hypothetical protein
MATTETYVEIILENQKYCFRMFINIKLSSLEFFINFIILTSVTKGFYISCQYDTNNMMALYVYSPTQKTRQNKIRILIVATLFLFCFVTALVFLLE